MDDLSIFKNSRSGDFRDMQRVENAYRRWERDIPKIKCAAFGHYAPRFCFGKGDMSIDLRRFVGGNDEFSRQIDVILSKRYYQVETRRKYISCLNSFLKWLTVPLNHITDRCILAYLCSLFNSNMKASTYSLHFCALRTIFDCFCGLDITENLDVSIGKKILESKYEALIKNFAATIGTIEKAHPKDGQLNPLVGLKRLNESGSDGANIVNEMSSKGLNIDEINQVFSVSQSVRDSALFFGVLLLDIKLNELLQIRRRDISVENKTIILWSGAGRKERDVELPEFLSSFFIRRMNEISEGDYLFSSYYNQSKALSGQGLNKILRRMLSRGGVDYRISSRQLRDSDISCKDIQDNSKIMEKFSMFTKLIKNNQKVVEQSVGVLNIEIGELVRYKGVVSTDAKIVILGLAGRIVEFNGIRISELGRGASLFIPDVEVWEEQLLWVKREVKERICCDCFKEKISEFIKAKYFEKKKSCYIRRKRVSNHWRATG